jgi:hypothetical protein
MIRRATGYHAIVAFTTLLFALTLVACAIQPSSASPSEPPARTPTAALKSQSLVMDMADDYIASLGESIYLLTRSGKLDAKGRWLAMSFLRNGVGASLDIAIGPNPSVNLLDLLSLVSLETWSFETHWIPAGIGEAGRPALARLKRAEADAWQSARKILTEEQLETLRALIKAWITENPDRTVVALVRFDEFGDERRISSVTLRSKAQGLLKEVGEMTAEVEDVRLLGEKLLWYAGRYPYLLGEQTELTAYRIIDQPEIAQLFETSKSAQRLSETLATRVETLDATLAKQQNELFARLSAERTATVNQFFDRFTKERSIFLDDLSSRREELLGIMKELHETITATERLAGETTTAATTIERVIARIEEGEGTFRVTDVRDAAIEAGNAAERLSLLLARAEKLIGSEDWNRTVAAVSRPADEIIDRIFWKGVILISLLIAGIAMLRFVPQRIVEKRGSEHGS